MISARLKEDGQGFFSPITQTFEQWERWWEVVWGEEEGDMGVVEGNRMIDRRIDNENS